MIFQTILYTALSSLAYEKIGKGKFRSNSECPFLVVELPTVLNFFPGMFLIYQFLSFKIILDTV